MKKKNLNDMMQVTTEKGQFLFIQLPEGTKDHRLQTDFMDDFAHLIYSLATGEKEFFTLPSGRYHGVAFVQTVTEAQAAAIVNSIELKFGIVYEDYSSKNVLDHKYAAIESLHTLMQANGMDVASNYTILKLLS